MSEEILKGYSYTKYNGEYYVTVKTKDDIKALLLRWDSGTPLVVGRVGKFEVLIMKNRLYLREGKKVIELDHELVKAVELLRSFVQ